MYRRKNDLEVFLVHPGGPFWRKKDLGAWSIPKGEYSESDNPLEAAIREFHEETGFTANGDFLSLGTVKQTGGKLVTAWAVEGDCDPAKLRSNTVPVHWPPRSNRLLQVPEVDRGEWFPIEEARVRLLKSQLPFLERLRQQLGSS